MLADDADLREGVDLSPVKAPAEIAAQLRWQDPRATLAALTRHVRLPQTVVDAQLKDLLREMLDDGLEGLVEPKPFADVIALDAPIDVILAVDTKQTQPRPMVAAAVGLSSLRGALGAAKVRPESFGPGMWKLGTDNSYGPRCVIAASGGKAPARLICGETTGHLEVLAPYLARTMPTEVELPVDGRFSVRLRGLAKRYGSMLRSRARGLPILAEEFKLDIPAFDDALMETATALAEEAGALIYDLDTIELDLDITPQGGMTFAGKFQFAGQQSWLVQAAVDGASLAGPAPDIFWHLPKASDSGSWGRSGDPVRYAKIFKTLQAMLKGGLQKAHFGTPADRNALARLLRLPFGKHVPTCTASGHFGGKPTQAPAGGLLAELFGDTLGWQLFGVEEGPAALRGYLQELVRVYNRPTMQQTLRKLLGSDAQYLPKVRTMPAPPALGGGSLDVAIDIPNIEDPFAGMPPTAPGAPARRATTTTLTLHLLLMADGAKRTWVGIGVDRNRLAKLMVTTKGATPGADSLTHRGGLDVFRRGRHTSGGMMTLQTFIESLKPGMTTAQQMGPGSAELQQVMALLERLPHQGKSPIIVLGRASGGGRPHASFEMAVPPGTLEDIGFLVRNILALAP